MQITNSYLVKVVHVLYNKKRTIHFANFSKNNALN